MSANEFKLEPVQEKTNLKDFDEAEETLSLCDLAIDGYETDWEGYSKEEQSLSFDQQDFFEFFSEEFTASDDIIFCGKLITYKEPLVPEKTHKPKTTNQQQKNEKSNINIFPWKSHSFSKSRTTSLSKEPPQQEKRYKKSLSLPVSEKHGYNNTRKCGDGFESSNKKVSIMATPVKSRRHLFAFGMGWFPVEMELRDIKTRQSKRSPATTMFRSEGEKEMVKGSGRRSGKGLWGLLRVLGCKSQHASAMVKASFACFPHVRGVGSMCD